MAVIGLYIIVRFFEHHEHQERHLETNQQMEIQSLHRMVKEHQAILAALREKYSRDLAVATDKFHAISTQFDLKNDEVAILRAREGNWRVATAMAPATSTATNRARCSREDTEMASAMPSGTAFVIMLCDDIMAMSTLTLLRSVKRTHSVADVVICVQPGVSNSVRAAIKKLGGLVEDMAPVAYPFAKARSVENQRDNKHCRYGKLRIWNMTKYAKIIYLDADMIVLRNIDELFRYPELSAVPDKYPGIFNSGLMVIEPNENTSREMMDSYMDTTSYNKGDQGFLNAFFSKRAGSVATTHHTKLSFQPLRPHFNMPIWLRRSALGKQINDSDIAVIHFTAEIKPWSFYWRRHKDFASMYDADLFYKWTTLAAETARLAGGIDVTEAPLLSPFVADMCSRTAAAESNERRIENSFTVMLSTNRGERLPLEMLVSLYSKVSSVHRIVVLWLDAATLPTIQSEPDRPVPLYVYAASTSSRNNRFLPLEIVRTAGVLLVDDDVVASPEDLAAAFLLWKSDPNRLLGPFVAAHIAPSAATSTSMRYEYLPVHFGAPLYTNPGAGLRYNRATMERYTMALTKLLFVPSRLFFLYTCLLPRQIHAYVDDASAVAECEDIAMNLLASVVLRSAPQAVDMVAEHRRDTADARRKEGRSKCLNDLIELFKGSEPLENYGAVGNFQQNPEVYIRGSGEAKMAPAPDVRAPPRLQLMGPRVNWDEDFLGELKRSSTDQCEFCGRYITRIWVYSAAISGRVHITGLRFDFGFEKALEKSPFKVAPFHGVKGTKGEKMEVWQVQGEGAYICGVRVHFSSHAGSVTGLEFLDSKGRWSDIIGAPSTEISSVNFSAGICGTTMIFGPESLEAIGFSGATSPADCYPILGKVSELTIRTPGHIADEDECLMCDRQVTQIAIWTREPNGKGKVTALGFEFGGLGLGKSPWESVLEGAWHGRAPRRGCGIWYECFLAAKWRVAAPNFINKVELYFVKKGEALTAIKIFNSDGIASPLFGLRGDYKVTQTFPSGICGVTLAAGIGVDAIALKSRAVAGKRHMTDCPNGGRHEGIEHLKKNREDRIWAEKMLSVRVPARCLNLLHIARDSPPCRAINQYHYNQKLPRKESSMPAELQKWAREQRTAESSSSLPSYKKRVLEKLLEWKLPRHQHQHQNQHQNQSAAEQSYRDEDASISF